MIASQRSVLVVVDMQNGFLNQHSQHIVAAVSNLVDEWYATGKDVLFTRYHNYPGSPFERLMNWTQLHDSPQVDIVASLADQAARAHAVLDKRVYTMFTAAGEALVQANGWTDLYFCGIATESCVVKSAVDAFERDLTPWLITDACASNAGDTAHQAGLLVASRFIGQDQLINAATAATLAHRPAVSPPSPDPPA